MLSLPDELLRQFNTVLDKQQFPENIKHFYRKWLRYYWDFCSKYRHDPFHRSSLSMFLKKLEQKRQSDQQREQAHQAILLFYQTKTRTDAISASLKTESQQPFANQALPMSDPATPVTAANTDASITHLSHRNLPHQKPKQDFSSENVQQRTSNEKQAGCNWVSVFDGLTREIKCRHYSPKTLKSYRGWTRRLQTFTKSKSDQALTQQDVI